MQNNNEQIIEIYLFLFPFHHVVLYSVSLSYHSNILIEHYFLCMSFIRLGINIKPEA